ncbi:hypothetical protein TNCV_1231801 [Trichonephila clavipes]|nr:hypothetical protein TNCV_1231801 [Trichonephila clavipes]
MVDLELMGYATTTNMLVQFDHFCHFIDILDDGHNSTEALKPKLHVIGCVTVSEPYTPFTQFQPPGFHFRL